MSKRMALVSSLALGLVLIPAFVAAQERLPYDNGLATYHTAPRYRESESHPIRPLSYFASSTEVTRSVFGYREPFDFRQPECFSADSSVPDCRAIPPFNYGAGADEGDEAKVVSEVERHVYFPDVNFDFNVRKLNDLGRGRVHQVAELLQKAPGVRVVLEGHADYIGSDKYNEKLGMDRAEAVRQELVAQGVTAERLSTVTFGKSKPIFAEQTDWARAVNRRVETHIEEQPAAAPAEPVKQ
jgi:outer membrane protein OmpA-like peptidoglycan-associated protein